MEMNREQRQSTMDILVVLMLPGEGFPCLQHPTTDRLGWLWVFELGAPIPHSIPPPIPSKASNTTATKKHMDPILFKS